ncbi:sulfatase [Paenibacillus sp. Soil750]|uniref:sulfatase n=1 Tax=Paenibacillus sp. Soil750 TaxID=1736398 RepID=UPI0006FB2657|nr:sulfatase [Paenibacillus sp. Soil750]KRE58317.1 sulfatase [Paenibacillus sp. Soil750]
MKTIVVLMDTLNRHMLSTYGGTWVQTPNIERLAEKSVVFEQHWAGSLPCMPARRDMMTGRTAFLEKGWGGIEPFDVTLPSTLREAGVFSHIVTDHYHYFATGGENYCQSFTTWDFHRGQEDDPWHSTVSKPDIPDAYYGRVRDQYERNRKKFVQEEDYPGPRTLKAACDWLESNQDEDQYFLMVEAFDPHEPFDCPQHYLDLYQDDYEGLLYNWPNYGAVDVPEEAVAHVRKRYAANLTMIDHWLGKLLDTMDRLNVWDDTLLVFTTDHGFLLGEHELMGKNQMHVFNELAHIPLMIHTPGSSNAGKRIEVLSQNIDLMPTILDYMGVPIPEPVKGHSLRGLLEGREDKVREAAIYGYHGMAVNVTDGSYTYMRAPLSADNHPCFTYTAMPTTFRSYLGKGNVESIEMGRYLPYTRYPLYKIPVSMKDKPYSGNKLVMKTELYDITKDYEQQQAIEDTEREAYMIRLLVEGMRHADAPQEQYERLGLVP